MPGSSKRWLARAQPPTPARRRGFLQVIRTRLGLGQQAAAFRRRQQRYRKPRRPGCVTWLDQVNQTWGRSGSEKGKSWIEKTKGKMSRSTPGVDLLLVMSDLPLLVFDFFFSSYTLLLLIFCFHFMRTF